jgi:hypothetical protein
MHLAGQVVRNQGVTGWDLFTPHVFSDIASALPEPPTVSVSNQVKEEKLST